MGTWEIADEVEAAAAAVEMGGEGPGPALQRFINQLGQQGHQVFDSAALAGTAWSLRQPQAGSAQLAAMLNSVVKSLDELIEQACPGARVSLTEVSPVRASVLYWAFVTM